jgi:N-acetylglucosamine-6-sulfatase
VEEPTPRRGLSTGRIVIAVLVAAALVTGGVIVLQVGDGATPPPPPSSEAPPNIVLILTDDQRWDSLWAMPNVRHLLADQGVTFTDSFVSNPLCCPSRASILTGQYSHGTGVYTNFPPLGGFAGFDPTTTIATVLRGEGYRTALVGKYFNGYLGTEVPPGWDRWMAFNGPNGGVWYYDYTMSIDGIERRYGSSPADYSTSVATGHAVRFIEETHQPFFLYFAPSASHLPAVPGPGHENAFPSLAPFRGRSFDEADTSDKPPWLRAVPRFDTEHVARADRLRAAQLRSLPPVDDAVRDIVEALDATGVLHRTLILFMSDNGFMHGEHRLSDKQSPYEEAIRVPMILRYDPLTSGGVRDPRMVANIDVAPTFADAAGTEMPGAEGTSLLNLLRRPTAEGMRWLLLEHVGAPRDPDYGSRPDRYVIPTYCGIRGRRWKYISYTDGSQELYDLAADPFEERNLIDDPSARAILPELKTELRTLCDPPPPGLARP